MKENATGRFLFFPFTHITQKDLDIILTFFSKFHSLSINRDFKHNRVLQQLSDQGKIIPSFISQKAFTTVDQKTKQFFEWTRTHKGNEHNLKLLLKRNPYFTSDSDVTEIKSQIRGDKKDSREFMSDESSLHKDLLFLYMAQLHDEQKEDIDLELKGLNKASDQLVSTLRGLEDYEDEIKSPDLDKYTYSEATMIPERIQAWFRYMDSMKLLYKKESDNLFITTNSEVFNYFESNGNDIRIALDIDNIKVHGKRCQNTDVWQREFESCLIESVNGGKNPVDNLPAANDNCLEKGRIKICTFWGDDINKIFNAADKHISVCLIKIK